MVDIIIDDDDDVGLHVLGCRVDILGTNCRKTLKSKDEWGAGGGGGRGVASASVRVTMSGGQHGAYCWIKKRRQFVVGDAFYCG